MNSDREELHVTIRVNDRAIADGVLAAGEAVREGVPVPVEALREGRDFTLRAADASTVVDHDTTTEIKAGVVSITARVIRRFRLVRWVSEQAHLVLPLIMMAVTVFTMQVAFLLSLITGATDGGATRPEPSPEYLARLLNEDYAGAEEGAWARHEDRAPSETKVESYYLQPGSKGKVDEAGGGQVVGAEPRSGDPRPRKAPEASIAVEELGQTEELVPQEEPEIEELADPLDSAKGEQEEHKQTVEVTEGWGLSDWYDTEDARRDAKEIERQLKLADQLLRLDPDDVYGLSIRAYYEYLAMDWPAAEATYDRLLQLDGASGAHWNNLALIYKRKGEFEKEEELYRVSLMMEPDEPNTYNNLAVCLAHQGRFDEALAIMDELERSLPDDAYADLHRAKIYAAKGEKETAYRFLRKSLAGMRKLDTLHNIEYQQDIRVDPAFKEMREEERFKKLLMRFYGNRPGGWWLIPGLDASDAE
ncbi:MAG: tetratricopeptide repeat protein [Deltaproteobacteria bacterium]|nr:tetratricopeptide repeat protein [Deltaproteobacteria bacterium]